MDNFLDPFFQSSLAPLDRGPQFVILLIQLSFWYIFEKHLYIHNGSLYSTILPPLPS